MFIYLDAEIKEREGSQVSVFYLGK